MKKQHNTLTNKKDKYREIPTEIANKVFVNKIDLPYKIVFFPEQFKMVKFIPRQFNDPDFGLAF